MSREWLFPNRATPAGSSAYYSIRLSPPRLRDDLGLLLGWYREVLSVPAEVSDPGVARLKLQWWREELERTYRGSAQHPLCQALTRTLDAHALPQAPFLGLIETVEQRIRGLRITDMAALEQSLEHRVGAIFELLSRCHGVVAEDQLTRARTAGVACGLVYLIRDLGANLRRGQPPLPTTLLRAAGLGPADLAPSTPRARLAPLLEELAKTARALDRRLGEGAPSALPPVVEIRHRILQALLAEIETTGFDVLGQRVGLTPVRKLWIAWRTRGRSTWSSVSADR